MLRILRLLRLQGRRGREVAPVHRDEEPPSEESCEGEIRQGDEEPLVAPASLNGGDVAVDLVPDPQVAQRRLPSTTLLERCAMVCFLEELDYSRMPFDQASFQIFRGFYERLQMMPRLEACVVCWEALARVGGDEVNQA